MQTPFEQAWLLLKQWDDVNWSQGEDKAKPWDINESSWDYQEEPMKGAWDKLHEKQTSRGPPPMGRVKNPRSQIQVPDIDPEEADGLYPNHEYPTDLQFLSGREHDPSLGSMPVEMSDIQRYQKETDFHNRYGPNSYNTPQVPMFENTAFDMQDLASTN